MSGVVSDIIVGHMPHQICQTSLLYGIPELSAQIWLRICIVVCMKSFGGEKFYGFCGFKKSIKVIAWNICMKE